MKLNAHMLNLTHNEQCDGRLSELEIYLLPDAMLLVAGKCLKCHEDAGLKYPLTSLYKWCRQLKRKALQPPLKPEKQLDGQMQVPFSPTDQLFLFALGVKADE